tara:strand:+ start:218 stop:700 length:483 start_codon:yes stop_codon:yes gene_type:complete
MHNRQKNKESKTYVQGLRSFGNTLPRGIKGILRKNGYNYSEIINKWSLLVGKEISNYSYPKSIKMSQANKNGILILSVQRGNEINIEYSKKEIINKINSYFGYKLVSEIKLQTFNTTSKKEKKKNILEKHSKNFEKKISEIENKDIRNSLTQLLTAVKND